MLSCTILLDSPTLRGPRPLPKRPSQQPTKPPVTEHHVWRFAPQANFAKDWATGVAFDNLAQGKVRAVDRA